MIALDLFAGTGWGVACQRLGIEEYGVEIMPEAVATREANGMKTIYNDVWTGLDGFPQFTDLAARADLLIASPPCQTFSMAGGGAGRKALDEVIGLIDDRAYLDVAALRAFGEAHDPRTALVLTPLAHVARDAPLFVVFEQVPPVLPVWERCAEEMRRWGYSVWTGIVNAEQYGVPQTRRRAILIARADGVEAKMPTPTHSRYYSRDPKKLDPGVLPWVSMAEALGWGMTERPTVSITGGSGSGGSDNWAAGGSHARRIITDARDGGEWQGAEDGYVYRGDTFEADRGDEGGHVVTMLQRDEARGTAKVRVDESASLPPGAEITVPLRRIFPRFAGAGATSERTAGQIPREADLPAHTVTGKNTHVWLHERPAATVAADDRIAERVTVAEAAALQSYPEGFEWCGTKTKQFLQIGNAVPPLLAEAILVAAIGRTE